MRRWSDNQRQFWPFTYARDEKGYRPFGIVLNSGHDEYPGCHLMLRGFGHTVIIEMPPLLRPWRRKVVAHSWSSEDVARLGRNWYWDEYARQYGFTVSDGFLNVSLGRQTHDSSTEQSWSYFLPWTQWRFIRHSIYDLAGAHVHTEWERDRHNGLECTRSMSDVRDNCPSASFEFDDFDGERITAKTIIEEREWHFGTGWFKWLSLFRRPQIRRDLDIEFSKETGPRKGSWKGGTVGHSIDMPPGELHEAAFRRYCAKHDMTFIGRI